MELVNHGAAAGVPGGSTRVIHHGGLTSSHCGVLHVPGTPISRPLLPPGNVPLQSTWIFFRVPSSVILIPSLPPVISQPCAAALKVARWLKGEPSSVTAVTFCGLYA